MAGTNKFSFVGFTCVHAFDSCGIIHGDSMDGLACEVQRLPGPKNFKYMCI